MAKVFTIEVTQEGRAIPVNIDYDKIVWSGLSWAVGEIKVAGLCRISLSWFASIPRRRILSSWMAQSIRSCIDWDNIIFDGKPCSPRRRRKN